MYQKGYPGWGPSICPECPSIFGAPWTEFGRNSVYEWAISGTTADAVVSAEQVAWAAVWKRPKLDSAADAKRCPFTQFGVKYFGYKQGQRNVIEFPDLEGADTTTGAGRIPLIVNAQYERYDTDGEYATTSDTSASSDSHSSGGGTYSPQGILLGLPGRGPPRAQWENPGGPKDKATIVVPHTGSHEVSALYDLRELLSIGDEETGLSKSNSSRETEQAQGHTGGLTDTTVSSSESDPDSEKEKYVMSGCCTVARAPVEKDSPGDWIPASKIKEDGNPQGEWWGEFNQTIAGAKMPHGAGEADDLCNFLLTDAGNQMEKDLDKWQQETEESANTNVKLHKDEKTNRKHPPSRGKPALELYRTLVKPRLERTLSTSSEEEHKPATRRREDTPRPRAESRTVRRLPSPPRSYSPERIYRTYSPETVRGNRRVVMQSPDRRGDTMASSGRQTRGRGRRSQTPRRESRNQTQRPRVWNDRDVPPRRERANRSPENWRGTNDSGRGFQERGRGRSPRPDTRRNRSDNWRADSQSQSRGPKPEKRGRFGRYRH